jgi:hypothetical protein
VKIRNLLFVSVFVLGLSVFSGAGGCWKCSNLRSDPGCKDGNFSGFCGCKGSNPCTVCGSCSLYYCILPCLPLSSVAPTSTAATTEDLAVRPWLTDVSLGDRLGNYSSLLGEFFRAILPQDKAWMCRSPYKTGNYFPNDEKLPGIVFSSIQSPGHIMYGFETPIDGVNQVTFTSTTWFLQMKRINEEPVTLLTGDIEGR